MAYDEALAQRVRSILDGLEGVSEKKMFGGLAFMLGGNMCCGVLSDRLVVRLGEEGSSAVLGKPGVRPMDFTGKPMKTMVYVDAQAVENEDALGWWVDRAVDFVSTLPMKR